VGEVTAQITIFITEFLILHSRTKFHIFEKRYHYFVLQWRSTNSGHHFGC